MLKGIELFSKWTWEWFCKDGFIQSPFIINSSFQNTSTQSIFSSPRSYALGTSKEGYKSRRLSVLSLFFRSSPAAVFSRVTAIVIDAFNLVNCGRASAHVRQKLGKVFFPIFTNFDASFPVSMIASRVRIVTSGLHGSPHIIFGGFSRSVFKVHNSAVTRNSLTLEG